MPDPRTVHLFSGARSEFEYLRPVLEGLNQRPGFRAEVVLAGSHLSPFHGNNARHLAAEGVPIAAALETLLASETPTGRALSSARTMEALSQFWDRTRPDLVIIAGDREEALAAAWVGNFLGIPVAHIHGGDRCLASDIDEIFRPAISKLAHLHFTATEGHRERLIRMGERPEAVWAVGAVSLDGLLAAPAADAAELEAKFGLRPTEPCFLVIHHPMPTLGYERGADELRHVIEGVLSLGVRTFASYPNFDPGNIPMRAFLEAAATRHPHLTLSHNLPRREFYGLYRRATAMIGNSSSIVLESGILGVPGVLVGDRQNLREIGPNVRRLPAQQEAIADLCRTLLATHDHPLRVRHTLYGDGQAGPRIAERLAIHPLGSDLLRKTMTY
jgi:GDP/UDP-N,N'-diacetylbacillosamine 2-epimerase (hydrolysing)